MGMIEHILNRLFPLEEIGGISESCPTYLLRWILAKLGKDYGAYLHKFVGDDWARDMHDHPKRFISIGLWGSYIEHTPCDCDGGLIWFQDHRGPISINCGKCHGLGYRSEKFTAPWIRSFPANHIHRVVLINNKPCWTLVFVGKSIREWGFWQGKSWIPWFTYARGDMRKKNCP